MLLLDFDSYGISAKPKMILSTVSKIVENDYIIILTDEEKNHDFWNIIFIWTLFYIIILATNIKLYCVFFIF